VTVSSNQVMISAAVFGCWPFSARPQMVRWTDSAMFNQEPLNGVYSGITPCANNHMTIDELKWPARLSQMRIKRSGGNGREGTCPNQVAHCACVAGSESLSGAFCNSARTCTSSACSHGCRTTFGALVTPLARTWPVAGRNRVSSLAVPPRMYSCG